MKVLLIYPRALEPRIQEEDIRTPPMGIWYLAAVLKKNGVDVKVFNEYEGDGTPEGMETLLRNYDPDVIGCSILNANRWGGVEICRMAKRLNPRVITVFGGPTPSCLWKHFLTHFPEIDVAVIGEGEFSFLEVVRCVETGSLDRLGSVRGIAFRREGRIVRTESRELLPDLDELPLPARYFTFQHVAASRGCVGRCTFCASPKLWGRRVRYHSVEYVLRQIEALYEKGVRFFYFSDDTFTLHTGRVVELCKGIVMRGWDITWVAISRVDAVSEEALLWMRKAGCIQLSFGVENGSPRIRKLLGKNISDEQIRKAFHLTAKYGILPRAYFIYGVPGEGPDTVAATLKLIREIRPLSVIFYILDLFPGTRLYEEFLERRGLSDDVWLNRIEDIMYWETDPALSREWVLSVGERLRTAFYRDLPRFARSIELAENPDLRPMHADFLSRLGMTFSHGDYSKIEEIEGKGDVARYLFERSLQYAPTARAYLGLGILAQQERDYESSVRILREAVTHFPDREDLAVSLGISLMNLGKWEEALDRFLRFPHSSQAAALAVECSRRLGKPESAPHSLRQRPSRPD